MPTRRPHPWMLALVLSAVPAVAGAEENAAMVPIQFEGTLRGAKAATETARLETVEGGLLLTTEGRWTMGGATIELRTRTRYAGEPPAPVEYQLDAVTPTGAQRVKALFAPGKVSFDVEAGGQKMAKEVPLAGKPVLLDNMIFGHYLVLGKVFALDAPGTWTLVVPQVLAALDLPVKPAGALVLAGPAGSEAATALEVTAANVLTTLWFRTADRSFVGGRVPLQQIEWTRTGWTLPAAAPARPPYADPAKFRAEKDDLASGALTLPATVCIPAGTGPFPAIAFVHGSGPNDRDETIGPNKPFRDLAEGLAARGILTYRYDKRTFAHPSGADITVEQEVTDDALAVLARLRGRKDVDPARVVLLGHSLGALLGPEIARADGKLAGLVLMAAPGRNMIDLLEDQLRFLTASAGTDDGGLLAGVARLRDGSLPDDERFMGVSGRYWRALSKRDACAVLRGLKLPVLVLQGERDYQVKMVDFEKVSAAVREAGHAGSRAISYPASNHLFLAGEGPSTPAEYGRAGFVEEKVVADIAAWVAERK